MSFKGKISLYRLYFTLTTFEGLLALFMIFREPSMEGYVGLFGYSAWRLALGAAILCFMCIWGWLAARAWTDAAWLAKIEARIGDLLSGGHRLLVLPQLLLAGIGLLSLALVAWRTPAVHDYKVYAPIFVDTLAFYEAFWAAFARALPLLAWSLAILTQTLFFLLVIFANLYRQAGFFRATELATTAAITYKTLLLLVIPLLTLFHWLVLSLSLRVFTTIPGWYWEIFTRPFSLRDGFFLAMVAVSLLVVAFVLKNPAHAWRSLIVLMLVGVMLQLGFGLVDGKGMEAIRLKYALSHHRSYALIATDEDVTPMQVVREYEARFGYKMFPSTKPPGVLMLYVSLGKLVDRLDPQPTSMARFLALTRFMAYVFPCLAFLIVPAIYAFGQILGAGQDAILPGMLYVFLPNVILIPLFLDQVMYPLLFMAGVLFMLLVLRKHSFWTAFLVGAYFYFALFFSFSMLPMLPLFLVLIGMDYLTFRSQRSLAEPLKTLIGLAAGVLVSYFAYRWFLNYDFFVRYETAMRVVRNFDFILRVGKPPPETFSTVTIRPNLGQIWGAMRLNNIELAAAVGFPIFLLFICGAVRVLARLMRRRGAWREAAMAAFFLTYVALNLYGQVQGEVSRLWIFWTPMFVIFASYEIVALFPRHTRMVLLLVVVQLITIFLTFQFQDFLV
jgi:hypothetical protein